MYSGALSYVYVNNEIHQRLFQRCISGVLGVGVGVERERERSKLFTCL